MKRSKAKNITGFGKFYNGVLSALSKNIKTLITNENLQDARCKSFEVYKKQICQC